MLNTALYASPTVSKLAFLTPPFLGSFNFIFHNYLQTWLDVWHELWIRLIFVIWWIAFCHNTAFAFRVKYQSISQSITYSIHTEHKTFEAYYLFDDFRPADKESGEKGKPERKTAWNLNTSQGLISSIVIYSMNYSSLKPSARRQVLQGCRLHGKVSGHESEVTCL